MRHRILHAATRLFAAQGFSGTSVQAISDAVGIQKPSLLYHFSSKGALRDAAVDAVLDRWGDVVPKVLRAATNGENRFEATLGEVMQFFAADRDRARLLMREILDRPDHMRTRMQATFSPWIGLVTSTIRRGQQEGVIWPDLDPDAWVTNIVALVVTTFATNAVSGALFVEDSLERRQRELLRIAHASLFIGS